MQRVTVIGHVGQDATIKDINGKFYLSFSVAHTKSYKNQQGEKVEKTTWWSCLKRLKENKSGLLEYLGKGTKVYLEGEPILKLYKDKDGQSNIGTNISVERLEPLVWEKNNTDTQKAETTPQAQQPVAETEGDDDLPF